MPRLPVVFYQNENGASPAHDWFLDLPKEDRKILGARLLWVQENWPVRSEHVHTVNISGDRTRPMYELRQNGHRKIFRVFFVIGQGKIVLLHGIQKTNEADGDRGIRVARERMKGVPR